MSWSLRESQGRIEGLLNMRAGGGCKDRNKRRGCLRQLQSPELPLFHPCCSRDVFCLSRPSFSVPTHTCHPERLWICCLSGFFSHILSLISSELWSEPTLLEVGHLGLSGEENIKGKKCPKTKKLGRILKTQLCLSLWLQKEHAPNPVGMCLLLIKKQDLLPKRDPGHMSPLARGKCALTEVKTSVVCWMVAIFLQPHFSKSFTRVGLWSVADG